MNGKYFWYAMVVTLISTVMSWGSMIGSSTTGSSRGSSWHSGSSYGGGGGSHK